MSAGRPRTVSVFVFDGMSPFESSIPIEVFGYPRPELEFPGYRLAVCSEEPGPLRVLGGSTLTAPYGLAELAGADTVIIPSVRDVHAEVSDALVAALRTAYDRGARIVSICGGAFALAAAGLLDGRRAATHWRYAALLGERFPGVRVDPDVLYVDEGQVLTGAGGAAGLDLCLHLVRQDFGADIANKIARRLVVAPHREGGQAQYVEAPVSPRQDDDRLQDSIAWALTRLTEPITLADLARQALMSTRSYTRHFSRSNGTSPIRWLIQQRVYASLPLLESTDMTVEEIARAVGFDTAVTYRQHFAKVLRTSPTGYRRTFQALPPDPETRQAS